MPRSGHAFPLPPYASALAIIGNTLTSSVFSKSFIVVNQIPKGDQLHHVSEIVKSPQQHVTSRTSSTPVARTQTSTTIPAMYIGGGIPPIPGKLVRCIQNGNFIDMAELLSANL